MYMHIWSEGEKNNIAQYCDILLDKTDVDQVFPWGYNLELK